MTHLPDASHSNANPHIAYMLWLNIQMLPGRDERAHKRLN